MGPEFNNDLIFFRGFNLEESKTPPATIVGSVLLITLELLLFLRLCT